MKTIDYKNIFIKAVLNGLLCWVLVALFTCAMHADLTLSETFFSLPFICVAISGGIGSYIGYLIKENR